MGIVKLSVVKFAIIRTGRVWKKCQIYSNEQKLSVDIQKSVINCNSKSKINAQTFLIPTNNL